MGVAVSVNTSHRRPQLLEAFLMAHAEALLLIHDQEAQIGELDVR